MADDKTRMLGLPDLKQALYSLTPKLKAKAVGIALRAGGKPVQAAIKARTPVLRTTTYSGASAIKIGRAHV